MRLSRRAWQILALVLLLLAISGGTCGLLLYTLPVEPYPGIPKSIDMDSFELSRGCCLGPAFVLIFLAYLSFKVGRRHTIPQSASVTVRWRELVTALGAALGLFLSLIGLSVILAPASSNPMETRAAFAGLFLIPGLFIIALSSIIWLLFIRTKDGDSFNDF